VQKGTVVFLVLMICSALIIGTTLGFISTREYLVPHLSKTYTDTGTAKTNSADSDENQAPSVPDPNASSIAEKVSYSALSRYGQPQTVNSLRSSDAFASAKLLVLTENEVKEVKAMLQNLGYDASSLPEAVKQFQEKNHLAATGYLDTETLTSIITQVLRQKVTKLRP